MRKKTWKKLLSISLVIALVILVGCQALGSLDLNKSLVDAMVAKSEMARGSVALEIKLDDNANKSVNADELSMLKLLSMVKLNLDQIKQESLEKYSVTGTLEVAKRSIPFQAVVTPTKLALQVEGAKKPLVLELGGASDSALSLGINKDLIQQLTDKFTKDNALPKAILSYFIKGLPNPEGIQISDVTDTVYGESMTLHHVQAQVDASQLIPILKKFVLNLLQDDQGLRDLVTQLYDALQPVLLQIFDQVSGSGDVSSSSAAADGAAAPDMPGMGDQAGSSDLSGADSLLSGNSFLKTFRSVLQDRSMAIELLHTEAKQVLVILMVGLEHLNTNQKDPAIAQFLNKNSYVKADLFLDNDGKLRKTKAEIKVVPPLKDNGGIAEVKLTMEGEYWNINQPVQADTLDTTDSYPLETISSPKDLLAILDKQSNLYQFLKDDLKITKKSIVLDMNEAAYVPYSALPYIESGVAMVPTRYISEQLDAKIGWDKVKEEITIADALSGTQIALSLGSDTAVVNGVSVKLDAKVQSRDGTSYVPLKFIASALGAKVHWEPSNSTITLTRD